MIFHLAERAMLTIDGVSYGKRLQTALDMAGRTRAELADAIGISVQAIGQVVLGRTSALKAPASYKAAAFLRVDPEWLATGEGSPMTGESPYARELARAFDREVPDEMRDAAYERLMSVIDLIATARQLPPRG